MDHHDHHDHIDRTNAVKSCGGGGGSGGTPATSRWNPTKEQINMLEGLYRQGIRTPSAEQIQQITSRLRAFGHIEGKNVFYWFQNHKARQRQKQKQESMAFINRFLHRSNTAATHSQPVFPTTSHHQYPYPNVVCGQYYVPIQTQSDLTGTLHQQYHQNKLPARTSTAAAAAAAARRPPRLEKLAEKSRETSGAATAGYDHAPQARYTVDGGGHGCSKSTNSDEAGINEEIMMNMMSNNWADQETLPLFPLSPTGILQGKGDDDQEENNPDNRDSIFENIPTGSTSGSYTGLYSTSSEVVEGCSSAGAGDKPFYDFFSH